MLKAIYNNMNYGLLWNRIKKSIIVKPYSINSLSVILWIYGFF